MDDIVLQDLEEGHQFSLTYNQETTVIIGCMGTRTRPPFSRLNVWRRLYEQEPEAYDVKVDLNDVILEGKFYPIFCKKDISV